MNRRTAELFREHFMESGFRSDYSARLFDDFWGTDYEICDENLPRFLRDWADALDATPAEPAGYGEYCRPHGGDGLPGPTCKECALAMICAQCGLPRSNWRHSQNVAAGHPFQSERK